jgi:iron complex outermembrane receptor protein
MRLSIQKTREVVIGVIATTGLSMTIGSVRAQSVAPGESSSTSGELQEVIVTAQKQAERLQDVPIPIEAFSGSELENAGVQTAQDLNIITPGLNYGDVVGYAQPHLRGIGTTASGAGVENPIATYVDGVYYGSMTTSMLDLANVDAIEIDKGPQGTLFGRNAVGGLIQITTKTPQQELQGSYGLTYGNYDTRGATGYITGGVAPDLAADMSVYYQDQGDGFGRNFYTGQYVNRETDLALRSKWLWTPSSDTQATLIVDFEHTDDAWALAPATIPLGGLPAPVPPQDLNGVFQPYGYVEQEGVSLNIAHHFGDLQFSSITSYRNSNYVQSFDGALTPYPELALNIFIREPDKQFTQEFQLRSPADQRIHWVTGFFWYQDDAKEDPVQAAGGLLYPLASTNTFPVEKTYSGALFGQATTEILPATDLTLGLRYTAERKNFHTSGVLEFAPGEGPPIPESAPDVHEVYSKPTWRLAIDHKLAQDLMIYASYNRGFKSGGFNNELLPTSTYAPEVLDAFEAGVKSELFQHRLTIDTSGFYYSYKNIQAVRYPAGLLEIYNGAAAEVYGLDLDVKARIANHLTVSSGLELLHAVYTSFPGADYTTLVPDGGGTNFATASATGNQLSQAPKFTYDTTADYSVPLPFAKIGASTTYAYNSGWFAEPDNRLRQRAYNIVNAQLYISTVDERYRLKFWARNLTNAAYAQSLASQGNGDYIQYAPPRTLGVTIEGKF